MPTRKRKALVRQVADGLVSAGVLTAEQVRNPAYYRHQVLEYARAQTLAAKGAKNRLETPRWARREGSTKDINANILEADYDWLHKAIVDMAAAKTIDWIKRSPHNIRGDLLRAARKHNEARWAAALAEDMRVNGYVNSRGRATSPGSRGNTSPNGKGNTLSFNEAGAVSPRESGSAGCASSR